MSSVAAASCVVPVGTTASSSLCFACDVAQYFTKLLTVLKQHRYILPVPTNAFTFLTSV